MEFLPREVVQGKNSSPMPRATASAKPLFCLTDRRHQKKISFPYGPARDGTEQFPANGRDLNRDW
jgi:hypothetical protein